MSAAATAKFKRHAEATARKERAIQRTIDRKDKVEDGEESQADAGRRARISRCRPFRNSISRSPAAKPISSWRRCTTRRITKARTSCSDKVALITGGDSGIGRAVAVLFAREGADVAIAYLNEHEDARGDQARGREGRPPLHHDPRRRGRPGILQATRSSTTVKDFGKLDILVNNAAFQEHVQDFEDLTEEHFDRTIKTNLYGYFHMAKAAVPHMKPGSAIVMTGSVTGLLGNKHLLDYSMTKGGIHAFTRSLATHLVDTRHPRQRRGAGPGVDAAQSGRPTAKMVANFGGETPMKRPAQPEEIAPGLCVSRGAELLELHHRRNPADHRRLFRRLNAARRTRFHIQCTSPFYSEGATRLHQLLAEIGAGSIRPKR